MTDKVARPRRKMRKHWYFITYYECPPCGAGDEIRERRYGRKPKDPRKCYDYIQSYDYCLG